jgi:hypothetical protein
MGLGTYLGYFVSQNGRGHVLGHVKDVGDDPTQVSYTKNIELQISKLGDNYEFHVGIGLTKLLK